MKQFLEEERAAWVQKLDNTEEQFLACEKAAVPSSAPPKKKARKKKGVQEVDQCKEDNVQMALLAATLKVSYFQKVSNYFILEMCGLLEKPGKAELADMPLQELDSETENDFMFLLFNLYFLCTYTCRLFDNGMKLQQ